MSLQERAKLSEEVENDSSLLNPLLRYGQRTNWLFNSLIIPPLTKQNRKLGCSESLLGAYTKCSF